MKQNGVFQARVHVLKIYKSNEAIIWLNCTQKFNVVTSLLRAQILEVWRGKFLSFFLFLLKFDWLCLWYEIEL